MESLHELYRPSIDASGAYMFVAPLGDQVNPLIHLDDLGSNARRILDNPSKSYSMDLEVTTKL